MYGDLTGYLGLMKREIQEGHVAAEIPKMFGGLLATLNKSYDLILSEHAHETGVQGMEEEKFTELFAAPSSAIDASVVKTEDTLENVPQEPSMISSADAEGEGQGESKDNTQQTALIIPSLTIPTADPSTAPAPGPGPNPPNAFCTLRAGLETVKTLSFSLSLSAIYLSLTLFLYLPPPPFLPVLIWWVDGWIIRGFKRG